VRPTRHARRAMARKIEQGRSSGVDATRIAEGLYMGSQPELARCVGHWDLVVLCAEEYQPRNPHRGLSVFHAPLLDGALSTMHRLYAEHAALVAHLLGPAQRVLVTCHAGFNRSGLVVARVLMYRGLSANEAISEVRKWRGAFALSNRDFVLYLHEMGT